MSQPSADAGEEQPDRSTLDDPPHRSAMSRSGSAFAATAVRARRVSLRPYRRRGHRPSSTPGRAGHARLRDAVSVAGRLLPRELSCCCAKGCRFRSSRTASLPSGCGRSREIVAASVAMACARRRLGGEERRARERDLVARLAAHGRSVLLFIRSSRAWPAGAQRVPARGPRESRRGADYLREIVHGLWGKDQPVFLVPLAIFRGSGLPAQRIALRELRVQRARSAERREEARHVLLERARPHDLRRRGDPAERLHGGVSRRGRGAHRAPADAGAADLPLSRGAAGLGPDAAVEAPGARDGARLRRRAGADARARRRAQRARREGREGGARLLRRDRRQLPRLLLRGPRVLLSPHVAPDVLGPRGARSRARHRDHEAAPDRAGAVPPQPLRLPDPLLHLPRELPVAAAHRRRHQHGLLAAGARSSAAPARTSSGAPSRAIRSTRRSSGSTSST